MSAVEFPTKSGADAIREQYFDELCPDDDRRLKKVQFRSDAPESVVEAAQLAAEDERADQAAGSGQVTVTKSERDQIDFTETTVPHARAVKALALDRGVSNWLDYYDPTLTVDEHRDVYDRAEGDKRLDAEPDAVERAGEAARAAQGEQCDHAEDHCKHGDPEACEFLKEDCGLDDEQVEKILDETEGEPSLGDLPGPVYHGLDGQWTQYKAGLGEAKRAAAAINEIRMQYGQDPLEFDELGGAAVTKDDLPA